MEYLHLKPTNIPPAKRVNRLAESQALCGLRACALSAQNPAISPSPPTMPFQITHTQIPSSWEQSALHLDRRRVRYRTAEDLVVAVARLLDDSPGDREIDELLGVVMAKLLSRGHRAR